MTSSGDETPDVAPDGSMKGASASQWERETETAGSQRFERLALSGKLWLLRGWQLLVRVLQIASIGLIMYGGAMLLLNGSDFVTPYRTAREVQMFVINSQAWSFGLIVAGLVLAYITIIRQ